MVRVCPNFHGSGGAYNRITIKPYRLIELNWHRLYRMKDREELTLAQKHNQDLGM